MISIRKPYNIYPKEFKLEALRLMEQSEKTFFSSGIIKQRHRPPDSSGGNFCYFYELMLPKMLPKVVPPSVWLGKTHKT